MTHQARLLVLSSTLLSLAAVGGACAGSSARPADDPGPEADDPDPAATSTVPDWYENPEAQGDSAHLVAVATAMSRRMQIAVDKAKTAARADLAEQLGTRYQVLRKRFQEELGSGAESELLDRYNSVTRSVTDQVLQGTRVRRQEIRRTEDDAHRAYVLMELPLQRADRRLLDGIMSDEEMYVRFRATEALEDLKQSASGGGRLLQDGR